MRVHVDEQRCSGHARCHTAAPDVFDLDEHGYNAARGHDVDVPEALERIALEGIRNCPERAITVLDDASTGEGE